ncbi:MAG: spore photoproduct lyase family protein [Sphaerochaetaceae bacterium]
MENTLEHDYPLWNKLEGKEQQFLFNLFEENHFTYQQKRLLIEAARDLALWQEPRFSELWSEEAVKGKTGKAKSRALIREFQKKMEALKSHPTDYSTFNPSQNRPKKMVTTREFTSERLLGRCPCPPEAEVLRCCNLLTLDAVQQCGFGCSYCSIQAFYHDEVLFSENLNERLKSLQLPVGTWHIGTGQSSDSLMWGNQYGVMDALKEFATSHEEIVLEMKSKSSRTDWLAEVTFPQNVVFTWSLNAPTIIAKEEHLSASLEKRIAAARRVADEGYLVGFHLHPLVHFTHWREEYREVVTAIVDNFLPSEVVMVSLGTLTFTKEVLKQLRASDVPSRILQMQLSETFGKYSYPFELKKELFSYTYHLFPPLWRDSQEVFFYLCMEDPLLWQPVLGHAYHDNATFEAAMRRHYLTKVQQAIDN